MRFIFFFIPAVFSITSAQERGSIAHLSGAGNDPVKDAIQFTDRAAFDPALQKYLKKDPRFLKSWKSRIKLANPPANSSPRTLAELNYLRGLQKVRTQSEEADIERQIKVTGMQFGSFDMEKLQADSSGYPATRKMLNAAQRDMELIVFQLKASFNRARPTHLTDDLVPSIEVPGHPAYPSGHSTQAHLLAYLLMEVAPGQTGQLVSDARQIARNREIAGVHYPGDSEAGQQLARQIVDLLLENREFKTLLEAAKAEVAKL